MNNYKEATPLNHRGVNINGTGLQLHQKIQFLNKLFFRLTISDQGIREYVQAWY